MLWALKYIIGGISFLLVTVLGSMVASSIVGTNTDMYLSPNSGVYQVGQPIVVSLRIRSNVPTNVFAGDIKFNPELLEVEKIEYNISIADLWAIEPWYENGAGTLQFAGGTTKQGGFIGDDQLLAITFRSKGRGEGSLELYDASILKYDGLGTATEITERTIDAIFSLTEEVLSEKTVFKRNWSGGIIAVQPEKRLTDLNGDNTQSISDVSIFMFDLLNKNMRSDFNTDGVVNTKDLSIIINAN